MTIRGHWICRHGDEYLWRAGRQTHATVRRDGDGKWIAWSVHLEGNCRFSTPREAKAYVLRRLRSLCRDMAPLFGVSL